ncbi:ion transporter [Asticcacaulis sp. SL142]|uniref:ion transporter n=1 Tax=Asticcacaulis sp. SL142 TaxID=2995155 RepID=UPI00226D327A|nr:ion transporter [Asticcacaulis sp. SL142]WAC49407.1 ion transporter [Asticcacaulis sp. SL142]
MVAIETWRARLRDGLDHPAATTVIVGLIVINAIVLGLETYPMVMALIGSQLLMLDQLLLGVFVVELLLRLFAQGGRFIRDPWNLFDTVVIALALLPASGALSVLRALRVVRVLRLISIFPSLRRVISGIAAALPGIGSIGAILLILYYVFAVMATKLFATSAPQWFGSLEASLFSLFQIMTLEGWADMTRELAQTQTLAIPFMVVFILVSTFTVLNLFISVMLEAMQRVTIDSDANSPDSQTAALETLTVEVQRLRARLDEMVAK